MEGGREEGKRGKESTREMNKTMTKHQLFHSVQTSPETPLTCFTANMVPFLTSLARKQEQNAPVPISLPFTQ